MPRVGNGRHHVGVSGRLGGEAAAHLSARLVHGALVQDGVGTREVDELEHAQRLARTLGEAFGMHAAIVDAHDLPRFDVADVGRADDVERAGLRGDAEPVGKPSDRQRPQPVRVARRIDAALVHHDEAERALEHRKHRAHGRANVAAVQLVHDERRDEVGIGRR